MPLPTLLRRKALAEAFAAGHEGLLTYAGLDVAAGPFVLGGPETHDNLITVTDGTHLGLSLLHEYVGDDLHVYDTVLNGEGPVDAAVLLSAHNRVRQLVASIDWSSADTIRSSYLTQDNLFFYEEDPEHVAQVFHQLLTPYAAGLAS